MSTSSQTNPTTVVMTVCHWLTLAGGRSGLHLRIQCTTESVAVKISPQGTRPHLARSRPQCKTRGQRWVFRDAWANDRPLTSGEAWAQSGAG